MPALSCKGSTGLGLGFSRLRREGGILNIGPLSKGGDGVQCSFREKPSVASLAATQDGPALGWGLSHCSVAVGELALWGGSSGYLEGQEGETRRRSMGWKLGVRHKASRTTLSCWIVLKGLETWVSLALVMPLRGPHLTSPVKYGQYHVVARCEAQMKEHHAS